MESNEIIERKAMDVFEAIKERRAVKHYDVSHELTKEEEEKRGGRDTTR